MNTVKQTVKKSNNSPAPKKTSALSSPATPPLKNTPVDSAIDGKKVLAPKPVAPISTPTPATANPMAIAAKVKDTSKPAPQPFALLAETSTARATKVVASEEKKASGPKTGVPARRTATTIEAKIDVGFGNTLYLRGQGPGLSWERGVPCECVDRDTWRWIAPRAEKLTFKLLLNDSVWARGADLVIGPGEKVEIVPAF